MANVSRRLCSFGLSFCHRRTKQWQCQKSRIFLVTTCQLPQVAARGFSTASPVTPMRDEVTVVYQRGLPVITLPLPSRREKCRFTLRPVSSTVGNFIADVQREDRGIDRIIIETTDGVRIAASTNIESLMQEDFHLVINNLTYFVSPPETGRITSEELQKLSDVKAHVAKLYEVLQVGDYQLEQERQLYTELEELKKKLEPMEKKKESLMEAANKRTTYMIWVGLTMMGVQFGVLARLTWWEYSWDIMEPVTYFITYGTTMAMYGYYVLTRQEYYLPAVRDRQFLFAFHKRAEKGGLNVQEYNQLKDAVARVESELKRLRDPLQLHLPIKELNQDCKPQSTTT